MTVCSMWSKVLAIALLCLCISPTVADPRAIQIHRRDGTTTPSITGGSATQSGSPSQSSVSSGSRNDGRSTTNQADAASSTSTLASTSTSSSTSSKSTSTVSAVISNINGPAPTESVNNSDFNSTTTPDELPLTPEITPAFAMAGVILILSGVVYALVGIKIRALHIYLSTGYLASLAVTVLILYVMNPPVSNVIQGAYLVAIAMTGLILGGAAIVFPEMTEGLGCLLGGFCLSMWLLVLKPGGLLTSTSGKSAFIAAFTVAAFATSFSHITRPYGLIGSISFGGATILVLGIDCFSRAGLKEFWAYVWNLNDNLFPVGATTYPLTRGIRVEIAAIIVISLAGIVSQMKLWKVIKERREQRAAVRLQDERSMEQEEEKVGRRIELHNAQSRSQWEAAYGDKDAAQPHEQLPYRDSGVGDMESQRKGPTSVMTSVGSCVDDEIAVSPMPLPTPSRGIELVTASRGQDGGPITVRVARDPEPVTGLGENGNLVEPSPSVQSHTSAPSFPQKEAQDGRIRIVGSDGKTRFESPPSQRNSQQPSGVPEVVPLPFRIPEGDVEDDRSSVATFAEDERAPNRNSRHLSVGSDFLRRLSQISKRSSKRFSRGESVSAEDLIVPRAIDDDRASSIAATMDGLSDDEDMNSIRSSLENDREVTESHIPVACTIDTGVKDPEVSASSRSFVNVVPEGPQETVESPTITTTLVPDIRENQSKEPKLETPTVQKSLTTSTEPQVDPKVESEESEGPINAAPSVASAVESKPASLTKDHLPPQLSRVVMSYRTNEWAKHLSSADAPEVEELKLAQYPAESELITAEVAVPVNVEELQQTPENALPAPARSMHQMPSYPPPLTRSTTAQSKCFSVVSIPRSIVESPIEEANLGNMTIPSNLNTPFGSTSTLMGQRDTMVRNKSYYNNSSAPVSTTEFHSSQFHSGVESQVSSNAGSIHNHRNNSSPIVMDDDSMSLSTRRELMRQSSVLMSTSVQQHKPVSFDSHQPKRQSTVPHPLARSQQLASWRSSMKNEFQSAVPPKQIIERQRSMLWQDKKAEEQRKAYEARIRSARDSAFDERMRRGEMLDAHREALKKMQAAANKHA